jgi:hypothetical protein
VDQIRTQFAAGGVAVDEQLDSRIKSAGVRANAVSAEGQLKDLEATTAHHDPMTINFLADQIRTQFVAGGTELTAQGRLPNAFRG